MTVSVRPWAEIAADLREVREVGDTTTFPYPVALEAAVAGDALAAEVAHLVDVIRLCRPYIMTDEHSEEADCDCDYMMDQVLKRYGVKRSDG